MNKFDIKTIEILSFLLEKINELLSNLIYDEYGLLITEPGSTSYANNNYFYFSVTDIKDAKKRMATLPAASGDKKNQQKVKTITYRNHAITSLPYQNLATGLFGKSFKDITNFYYTDISNFIFAGNTIASLKVLIDAYEDDNLLTKTTGYASLTADFSLNCNYMYYAQVHNSYYLLRAKSNKKWSEWLDNNKTDFEKLDAYAYSIKSNNAVFETNIYLHTAESTDSKVNTLWSAQLDNPIAIEPQLIESNDSVKYIAIQDTANQLYLIDNSGNLLWKKTLPEKIVSRIVYV